MLQVLIIQKSTFFIQPAWKGVGRVYKSRNLLGKDTFFYFDSPLYVWKKLQYMCHLTFLPWYGNSFSIVVSFVRTVPAVKTSVRNELMTDSNGTCLFMALEAADDAFSKPLLLLEVEKLLPGFAISKRNVRIAFFCLNSICCECKQKPISEWVFRSPIDEINHAWNCHPRAVSATARTRASDTYTRL